MEEIIKVAHLSKQFKDVKAVNDLSFIVKTGERFAFIGPNGAGKSTTIEILSSFLKPDAGTVEIAGYESGKEDDKIRQVIGVVHQQSILDPSLTTYDNLLTRAQLLRIKNPQERVLELAKACELSEFLERPLEKLSGGQRRRVDIARALLNKPKLIFLDEPTTGLDPQSRRHIWDLIMKLQAQEKITVFLTTHYLEEANACDYMVIIDHGQAVAAGRPADLREKYSEHKLILTPLAGETEALLALLQQQNCQIAAATSNAKIASKQKTSEIICYLKQTLDAKAILDQPEIFAKLAAFEVEKGTLDDAFIRITGKELRE